MRHFGAFLAELLNQLLNQATGTGVSSQCGLGVSGVPGCFWAQWSPMEALSGRLRGPARGRRKVLQILDGPKSGSYHRLSYPKQSPFRARGGRAEMEGETPVFSGVPVGSKCPNRRTRPLMNVPHCEADCGNYADYELTPGEDPLLAMPGFCCAEHLLWLIQVAGGEGTVRRIRRTISLPHASAHENTDWLADKIEENDPVPTYEDRRNAAYALRELGNWARDVLAVAEEMGILDEG